MKLIVNKDRSVIPIGTWGTKNENNYEILDFEFPEELEEYNKRIVYYLGDKRVWDAIIDNKAILTNAITTQGSVKAYIWCTKSDEAFETDVDFRTQIFVMNFFENDNADGIVPTPEQVDGFNTMLTAMNEKIEEIDALETTIENAETQRQENEETRQENESTRQENEQTRQSQEAERERRTDEAIRNIQDKTAEYNANAEAKTAAFNNNATQKTNDFNSNYTQKVNDFNTNASSKELAFNSNAESKTSTFNTNATNKTNDFNSNASSKTTAFNNNATSKTTDFNTNAENKTTAFNSNATDKTTNFDNNASGKTDEFNTNAQEKIDEYDEHIVEYQAQIDELQEEVEELSENMPWNTTEQATEISVDDAAKYSKNKLELYGNTNQASTTGKNIFNGDTLIQVGESGTKRYGFYVTTPGTYTLSYSNNSSFRYLTFKIIDNGVYGAYSSTHSPYTFTITQNQIGIVYIGDEGKTFSQQGFYNVQIETGETATDFEPYTNGPSPNPDYPQPIHVVTGNNTIGVTGKNILNWNLFEGNDYVNIINKTQKILSLTGKTSYYSGECILLNLKPSTQYTIKAIVTTIGTNSLGRIIIHNKNYNGSGRTSSENRIAVSNSTTEPGEVLCTFTTDGTGIVSILFQCNSATNNGSITYENIQLEEGAIASSFEPYTHTDYSLNLGSLELCKIGNYQDYLYKENGNWYKYEAINKSVLNGTEANWSMSDNIIVCQAISNYSISNNVPFVNYFKGTPNKNNGSTLLNNEACFNNNVNYSRFYIKTDKFENIEDFKTWLSTNNLIVYCIVRNVATTQITDETLISQLEAIYNHLALVKGTNHITITPSDLAPYVTLNYMQDLPSKLDNLDSRLSLLE